MQLVWESNDNIHQQWNDFSNSFLIIYIWICFVTYKYECVMHVVQRI